MGRMAVVVWQRRVSAVGLCVGVRRLSVLDLSGQTSLPDSGVDNCLEACPGLHTLLLHRCSTLKQPSFQLGATRPAPPCNSRDGAVLWELWAAAACQHCKRDHRLWPGAVAHSWAVHVWVQAPISPPSAWMAAGTSQRPRCRSCTRMYTAPAPSPVWIS